MSLVIGPYAIGSHAWFFEEGAAYSLPDAGVAAVDALPGADDEGWKSLGDIETWEDSMATDEEKELWKPAPGHLVRKDIIPVKQAMNFKFVSNDLTPLAAGLFYRADSVLTPSSFQFNPLSGVPRKGWLKVQRYGQGDDLIISGDLWVRMKVTGGIKGGNGEVIMPEFTALLLDSSLNTMALGES